MRGRFLTDQDDATRPRVTVINKAFADKYFLEKIRSARNMAAAISLLTPSRRSSVSSTTSAKARSTKRYGPQNTRLTIRTLTPTSGFLSAPSGDERFILPALAAAVHQVDPGIGTYDEQTMTQRISNSPTAYVHRSAAWLVGGFAALALLLGVVGLYGVIAYSVSQRTREIGVRMALGAARSSVYQLVLKEAGRLTIIGIVAGILCAIATATLIRKLLFGIHTWDFQTLAAVAVLLGFSALLASFIPARRAASIIRLKPCAPNSRGYHVRLRYGACFTLNVEHEP